MYDDLKGKVAIITGSGKKTGMGYAIARKLAACGADVVIADLGAPDPSNAVATGDAGSMELIGGELAEKFGVRSMAVPVDVTSTPSVSRMAEEVRKMFGRVDVLCNNAGAAFGVPSALHDYDEAQWHRTLDVNLHGTFRVCKAVLPLMMGKPGSIINTASRAGKVPTIFNGAYAVAKAGVIMFTKVMARELGGMGIRVNAVCPAQIRTDLLKWQFELEAQVLGGTPQDREREMCATIPLGRVGEIEDVADLVAFLASDESRYITGQAVNMCGGQVMEL